MYFFMILCLETFKFEMVTMFDFYGNLSDQWLCILAKGTPGLLCRNCFFISAVHASEDLSGYQKSIMCAINNQLFLFCLNFHKFFLIFNRKKYTFYLQHLCVNIINFFSGALPRIY